MNNIVEKIKNTLRPAIYYMRTIRRIFLSFVYPSKIKHFKQIPIIINNRNRFEYLLELIQSLEVRGYTNIFIIDNDSTYPPLLEYYKICKYKIFMLGKNVGHLAMWETDVYKRFIKDYYVYTDSDVVPVENCPSDFLDFFWKTLRNDYSVQKVGFSLKIDDLPDSFKNKNDVIEWEKQFYEKNINDFYFEALIDTTFALYRPFMKAGKGGKMYRTAFPYQAYHKPWYVNSEKLSLEESYYIDHAVTSTHWTILNTKK